MTNQVFPETKKKRRWPWVLLVVVLLLGGTAVGGEFWARAQVADTVRTQAIQALGLPADQQIDVHTEGLILPQLIGGKLTSLQATSDAVKLGPITGDVVANAKDVPIRGGESVGEINGTITIDQAQLLNLIKTEGLRMGSFELPLETLEINDGALTGNANFAVLGIDIPVSLTLGLSTENGDLMITPVAAKVGNAEVEGQALRDTLGGIAGDLLGPYRVCVAQYLPAALTVTDLQLAAGKATVHVDVNGNIATDPSLSEPGVCAAG